ncbi:CheR family methyltransferase [Sulfurospirillum barnesii]|uniref:Methylase of chemotaxis methyl-accepting protein n=1 Tax=Sulfurospirillum barnesii (strain ATCC 700032 / DSM 10660 / SES-3) TaxID=760154 RepID=I3XW63_SULBS|nr:protein-glutamate O-methyltransferase CheR [Sulfurospirillum barnesii]AFL68187.1 methylase of chemotaxis methyl-accepting protein [Sulfurospirillum barnesii SES-3]
MWFWNRKKEPDISLTQNNQPPQEFNPFGLQDVLHYIKREIGVDLFSKNSVIETKLRLFCERKEIYSFRKLFEALQYDTKLRQELIDLVTVNETYFYREESQLELAVEFAMKIPSVKILCAPCATGEEVYSLSMMLQEKKIAPHSFSITGIDINSEAIEKAQRALFSERSLHKLDAQLKEKYFLREDRFYSAKKEYFTSISFRKVNIFEGDFLSLGSFDIIFSRNMLIYFDDAFRLKTIERFASLLKPEGKLFLGHADIIPENHYFTKHTHHRLSYYVKNS